MVEYGEYQDDGTMVDNAGRSWRRVRNWEEPSEAEQLIAVDTPYLVHWCGSEEPRSEPRERFKRDVLRSMPTRVKADRLSRRRSVPTIMVGELWRSERSGDCLVFVEQGPYPRAL